MLIRIGKIAFGIWTLRARSARNTLSRISLDLKDRRSRRGTGKKYNLCGLNERRRMLGIEDEMAAITHPKTLWHMTSSSLSTGRGHIR